MADFSIEIPVGMDVSQVNAALKKFNGDIQQTAKYLKELKDSIAGESQLIGVQFVATDSTKPAFKAVSTGINSVNKESKGLENQLTQLTKVYSGSVTSIRQTIAARKQELAGLRNTDTRYKSLTKEIEQYQQALNKAKGIQEGSITSLRQQQQKFQELADSLALGSAEQIKYANAAKKIEAQIKKTTNPLGQFFGVLNRIATLQAGFTAFAAIIGTFTGSLNKFVGQLKALEGFELALKNVGLSTAEVNDRLQDATRISAELGAPLEQVEKSFKRMVPALEAVGVNAEDSGRFLEGIAARTQTLGLNTEQTGRFMEAFAQVLSKGKLQSEELNQQISELDGAFRAQLAKSLNVTTQELEDMIQKGEITSTVFVKAFNDMSNGAEALKKRIQDGNATIQQLQNLIDIIDTTNLRRIGKAIEPGIKAILEIQLILAEFIETVSKSEVGAFLATVFNEIAKGARDFVKAVTGVSKLINALLEPIAAVSNLLGGLVRVLTVAGLAFVTFKAQVAISAVLTSVAKSMTFLSAASLKLAAALGTLSAMNSSEFAFTLATGLVKVKAALSALLVKLAPFVLLLGAAKVVFDTFQKFDEQVNKPVAELKKELQELEEPLKNLPSLIQDVDKEVNKPGFLDALGKLFNLLFGFGAKRDFTDMEKVFRIGKETTRSIERFNKDLARIGVLSKEGGIQLGKLNDVDTTTLTNSLAANEAFTKKLTETMVKLKKETDQLEAAGGDEDDIAHRRKRIAIMEKEVLEQGLIVKSQKEEIAARMENREAIERQASSFKDLQNIQKQQAKVNELVNKQLDNKFMKRFGDSADTASTKLILLTSAQHKLNEATKEGVEEQLKAMKARETSPTGFTEEDKQESIKLLSGQLLDAEKAVAESSDKLNQVIQDDLKRTLDNVSAVADGYTELANTISQGAASIASTTTGAFGDLRSLLNAVSEREMEGRSPQQQQEIEENRLRMMARINEIEDLIARSRLDTEFQIAKLQNQQLQARLAAERTLAINAGDVEGAARLQEQIDLSKQIGVNQEKVYDMEVKRLDIQKALKDEMLLQEALDKGMFSNYKNRNVQEQKISEELGLQRTTLEDINDLADDLVRTGVQDVFKMDKAAIDAQTKGFERQKGAMKEVNDRLKFLETQNNKVVESGKLLGTAFENVKTLLSSTNSEADKFKGIMLDTLSYIEKMIGLLGGQTQARFMGGPVEGGQTYRVNDAGLGREAFMNKFGDVKMLPAASNMNWTAPSSGTIIPAKVVKAMQKNADINANISAKQTRQTPNISNIASSAASGVSGSLAKQLGSAVSGSTSNRITNNVTIQSQSPVNDASDLMTNVARMRLRNSRRI